LCLVAALASVAEASSTPPPGDRPVIVKAGFMLYDINEVEETTETFEFEGALLLNWQDPREAFDVEVEGVAEKVFKGDYQFNELFDGWWPQVFLSNESSNFERQGIVLRIEPDGNVWYVEEIDATAESPSASSQSTRTRTCCRSMATPSAAPAGTSTTSPCPSARTCPQSPAHRPSAMVPRCASTLWRTASPAT
jgi:hypothetical protein